MTRCAFLIAVAAMLVTGVAAAQPNVIVVMTDDQGYGDLSCHGNPVLSTPHLDALHSQSVRLTDFHVAPMCTPTRGQLLTGIDAARNGAINVSSGRTLLKADLPTMADLFAAGGYRTGIFGKWHLGDNFPFRPQDRGFEETLWFPSSHINSTPDVWDNDYFDDTYQRNGQAVTYQGYCTDVFFAEAIAWMKRRAEAEEPFFAYLPTNAPHSPYWLPEKYSSAMERDFAEWEASGKAPEFPPQKRREVIDFLGMIKNIDDNVGKLTDFLDAEGIADDTVVIFLTDNGSTKGQDYFPAGMRGRKTQLWEGGHRVPCFVRWPAGGLSGGRDVGGLTQVQDLLPTLLSLCEIDSDRLARENFDGLDLSTVLRDESNIVDDRMLVINYSRMPFGFDYPSPDSPSVMRREGAGVLWKRWRWLEDRELYDLTSDPLQQQDVAAEHPDVVAKMRAHLDQWWQVVGAGANEPQRVVIGDEAENPMLLTACEWLDVFIDQQQQIRRGDRKNGWWELEVAEAGEYEFELRRWPRDADLALSAGVAATEVADGVLEAGVALPIAWARMKLGTGPMLRKKVGKQQKAVMFSRVLPAGPIRLHTWFEDADRQAILGAYYVYVRKK